ncbi:CcdB family protein [Acidisphaera sp. L21]|uniref:CcdB family protein n=1 Tax=Acidisphaera sp. L21 TaxID=1641851 RepID=UPI00131B4FD5|nr:CcdB family protein [Acidisphaera sp. L21]
MQHDVFVNPGPRTRLTQPYLAVLQSDVAEGLQRFVCPLFVPHAAMRTKTVLVVHVHNADYLLPLEQMTAFPTRHLRRPVGSIAAYRDDIVAALDWLFTGI